jgi:hypothetical protein
MQAHRDITNTCRRDRPELQRLKFSAHPLACIHIHQDFRSERLRVSRSGSQCVARLTPCARPFRGTTLRPARPDEIALCAWVQRVLLLAHRNCAPEMMESARGRKYDYIDLVADFDADSQSKAMSTTYMTGRGRPNARRRMNRGGHGCRRTQALLATP